MNNNIFKNKNTTLLYNPTPKCGNSTMKEVLFKANGFDYTWQPGTVMHKKFPCVPFRHQEANIKFCIVRDPAKRFMSAYSNRVGYYKEASVKSFDDFFEKFENFYRYNNSIRLHFAPQVKFVGKNPAYYSNIFYLNQMNDAIDLVSDFYKIDPLYIERQTYGSEYKVQLQTNHLRFIKEFYKEDYEFLKKIQKKT